MCLGEGKEEPLVGALPRKGTTEIQDGRSGTGVFHQKGTSPVSDIGSRDPSDTLVDGVEPCVKRTGQRR